MSTSPLSAARLHRATLWLVPLILVLFVGVGFWYSVAVPSFETPDEVFHYAFARHLAAGNPLPVQNPDVAGPWEQEGSQAPLYYLLTGWLTASIDQSDFAEISVRNPRANIGDPLFPGNKNFMLYSSVSWPLTGANLALHVGRWFSLGLGVLTLWCTYLTVRLAFPVRSATASPRPPSPKLTNHPAHTAGAASADADSSADSSVGASLALLPLLAVLLMATIPQFLFLSAAFSNDNLINAASAAVIYWLAWLLVRGQPDQPPLPLWAWLLLGGLLGIAALSKLQGLGLWPLSALVGLWIAWVRRDWGLPWRVLLPVALPALMIAGWWYWRNFTLYDDWLGVSHLLANNGRREEPLTLLGFWREFRGLRYSFWGLFGWFNLLLPQPIYSVLDGLTVLAVAGLTVRLGQMMRDVRRSSLAHLPVHISIRLLLVVWSLFSIVLLLYWTSQATGSQGRLLFPALGAFAILFVWGLELWISRLPARLRLVVWCALPLLLLGASLYTLTVLVPASYQAPAPIAALPEGVTRADLFYSQENDQLHLLGLTIPERRYTVGEAVPVTLYLQTPRPVEADYQLFIQLLDERGREVGNLTSHPAWGRNPTSLWQPGAIYADAYPVTISGPLDGWAPLLARVYIGFVDPTTEERGRLPIPARTGAGEEITPFVSQVAISPAQPAQPPDLTPRGVQFGGVIGLTGALLPATLTPATMPTLTVTVQWDALGPPATEYTAFFQVRTESGAPVAGFDQAPAGTRFPTPHWQAGDRIVQSVAIPLPAELAPGRYAVWVGLYETASQGALRLPITATAGQSTGDGEMLLGIVEMR
jgi:hypothetical protein